MQQRLGPDFDAFIEALQQPAPVSIRYNPAKVKAPAGDAVPWCTWGRYLAQRPSFTLDPIFHGGGYYVQEASSMLLEQAVRQSIDLARPQVVLDLCASPGGKSTHLLSLLSADSLLVSNEAVRGRTSALLDNLESWGNGHSIVVNNDPADFGRLPGFFDVIVADAPCSGEGLFRKDVDARQEWSEHGVELCASRQRRILADAWAALRPGGVLIYSTCTYNDLENRANVDWMAAEMNARIFPLKLGPAWGVEETEGGYQCFPHKVRGEGFFVSVLKKPDEAERRLPKVKDTLRSPSSVDVEKVEGWLEHSEERFLFLHGTQLQSMAAAFRHELLACLSNLHVLRAGLRLGEVMRNKVVPDHSLALNTRRSRGRFGVVTVDKTQALSFLRREAPIFNQADTGFHVVVYEGLGLGWVNVLPGRVNNLLPSNRRVRLGDANV